MTIDPSTQDDTAAIREQLRLLLREFRRFGVDSSTPEFITASTANTEEITRSRQHLVNLLRDDQRLKNLDQLGRSELEGLRLDLVRLSVEGRLQNYLSEVDVPFPIYNFFAGFDSNADGPWDKTPPAESTPLSDVGWKLMGIPVRFPIGVPASGLTANSRWIRYFARQGFNILTYKTVRSREYKAHRWPHWVFIEDTDAWSTLSEAKSQNVSGDLTVWPKDLSDFSTANSFGMPSSAPIVWQRDVEESLRQLETGQLLIVSVVGSAEEFEGGDLVDDFVAVAKLAEATGASTIELNLSCPNTVSRAREQGMRELICADPIATSEIVQAVHSALGAGTKLVAKLGCLDHETLADIVERIGGAVDGISGINTVQVPIVSPTTNATPFIGTSADPEWPREEAGISGHAIRQLGLRFVSDLTSLRKSANFDIIGMGGVMSALDVDEYLLAGASAVQTATGACLHPDIPAQVAKRSQLVSEAAQEPSIQPKGAAARILKVAEVLASGGYSLLSSHGDGRS